MREREIERDRERDRRREGGRDGEKEKKRIPGNSGDDQYCATDIDEDGNEEGKEDKIQKNLFCFVMREENHDKCLSQMKLFIASLTSLSVEIMVLI